MTFELTLNDPKEQAWEEGRNECYRQMKCQCRSLEVEQASNSRRERRLMWVEQTEKGGMLQDGQIARGPVRQGQ